MRFIFGGKVVLAGVMLLSCYHHLQPPTIDVIRVEAAALDNEPSAQDRLRLYLQRYPHFRTTISDAVALVDAEQLAHQGDVNTALVRLREAFAVAAGEFRKHIFTRYLTLLADNQAHPQPLTFFVEHAKTWFGYSGRRVTALIASHLRTRLARPADEVSPLPANLVQLMQEDPTLELSAQRYCREQEHTQQWEVLLTSFTQQIRVYWQGLTSACRGDLQAALRHHRRYLRYAAATSIYPQLL